MPKQTEKHPPTSNPTILLPYEDYYTEDWLEWIKTICALNDAFRFSFTSTELYCSPEILKLSVEDQSRILELPEKELSPIK